MSRLPYRVAHLHSAAGVLHDGFFRDGDERGHQEGGRHSRRYVCRIECADTNLQARFDSHDRQVARWMLEITGAILTRADTK